MENKELASSIQSLIEEYRSSEMPIDDFLRAKLSGQRKDADVCADKVIETFRGIDENYASLKSAKEQGNNRQEWMRKRIAEIEKSTSGQGRVDIGEILTRTIDELKSTSLGTTPSRSFEGMDAVDMIRELDCALVKRAIVATTTNEEGK